MRSGTPLRDALKCNDATGSVWDADEPEESDITFFVSHLNEVLVSRMWTQKHKHLRQSRKIKTDVYLRRDGGNEFTRTKQALRTETEDLRFTNNLTKSYSDCGQVYILRK